MGEDSIDLSPAGLKKRFKVRCDETNHVHQNWQIRVHRSLSWFKRAMEFSTDQPEAKFLFLWIAVNALYGKWDVDNNRPDREGPSRRGLLQLVCTEDRLIVLRFLQKNRVWIKKLLNSPFLSPIFWEDPKHPDAKTRAIEAAKFFDENLKSKSAFRLMEQIMERLFVLRGQIVHGASTGGSSLNREPVNLGVTLLVELVPMVQHVVIEKMRGDDWPELCYPPIK